MLVTASRATSVQVARFARGARSGTGAERSLRNGHFIEVHPTSVSGDRRIALIELRPRRRERRREDAGHCLAPARFAAHLGCFGSLP